MRGGSFHLSGLTWAGEEIFSDISDACPHLKVWIPSGFDFYLLPSWLHLTFPCDSNFKAIMSVRVSSPKYHENWKLWDLKSKTRTTWTLDLDVGFKQTFLPLQQEAFHLKLGSKCFQVLIRVQSPNF